MRSFGREHVLQSTIVAILFIIAGILTFIPVHLYNSHASETPKVNPRNHTLETHNNHSRLTASATADWPEFHADAARDGTQSSNVHFSKSNVNTLAPLTGPAYTTTGAAMSSPAIFQGILYYAANTQTTSGSTTLNISTIYAVNISTGQTLWSEQFPACQNFTKKEWSFSSPAVTTGLVNGTPTTEVFIGWGAKMPGAKGCVYDFNGLTGNVIWTYLTSAPVHSSPAIMTTNAGNLVVVGDNSTHVHAFSVDYTGTIGGKGLQVWNFNTSNDPPPPGYSQYCAPAPALCGDAIWSSPAEGTVLVNNIPHHYAFIPVGAETNTVGRLDAIDMDNLVNNSPTLAWAFWDPNPLFDDDFGSVSVLNDNNGNALRVFTGMNNGHMFGVDATTGALAFDFSLPTLLGTQGRIHSIGTLVTLNGTTELIFAAGCTLYRQCGNKTYGYVFAVDALSTASNGTLLWRSQNFGDDVISSPIAVNSGANAVIFIMGPWNAKTSTRGDLLALDPSNGSFLADYPVYNHAYGTVSTPAVYGNSIFVTEGYTLYGNPTPGVGGLAAFQCPGC